jgi:hypothetical protein
VWFVPLLEFPALPDHDPKIREKGGPQVLGYFFIIVNVIHKKITGYFT